MVVPVALVALPVDKLQEAGVAYEYDRVEGWPHTMDLETNVNRHCLAKIEEFLDKHLQREGK